MPRIKERTTPLLEAEWNSEVADPAVALAWSPDGSSLAAATAVGQLPSVPKLEIRLVAVSAGEPAELVPSEDSPLPRSPNRGPPLV